MTELKGICIYCMGCNKLENLNFAGTNRCAEFKQCQDNWYELYREDFIKNAKNKNTNTLQK